MKEIEGFSELKLRYLNGNRRTKDEILKSLCTLHGYHRKSAIRLLNQTVNDLVKGRVLRARGRKARYQDPEFIETLRRLWRELEYMCARNLLRAIPDWLLDYQDEYGTLSAEIIERLSTVSPSTVDRLLKPYRSRLRSRCGTQQSHLKDEIPLSRDVVRDDRPGHIELDTVALCGGDMSGRFVWILTATDIVTGWTEVRVVWAKGIAAIIEAFKDMQLCFPFPILSFDSDNGSEFINFAISRFLAEAGIAQSRSRSYRKNDNAHVEQKNRTHVRHYLGDARVDNPEVCEALDKTLRDRLSVLRNLFFPNRRLLSKSVRGGITYKVYDTPETPLARVLASSFVHDAKKAELRELHSNLRPIKLRKQLQRQLRQVLRHSSVTSNFESPEKAFGNIEL